MINRLFESGFESGSQAGNIYYITGPRKVGKSSILKSRLREVMWLDGDEASDRVYLRDASTGTLANDLGSRKILVISEAQRIENLPELIIQLEEKLPGIQVYIAGSKKIISPGKGNADQVIKRNEIVVFPLSFEELSNHHGISAETELVQHRMIFGYYPDIVTNQGNEKSELKNLVNNYLFHDILSTGRIQNPGKLERLIQLLALKAGEQSSCFQLAKSVGMTSETIEKYIQLLESHFLVFRLYSFSRNLGNELSKSWKVFFYDNGLRNAIIGQFSQLSLRADKEQLWHNFIISERIKYLNNHSELRRSYFWKTKDKAGVDYLEEEDGLSAFSLSIDPPKKPKVPRSFIENYKPVKIQAIHMKNFQHWISNFPVPEHDEERVYQSRAYHIDRNRDFCAETD